MLLRLSVILILTFLLAPLLLITLFSVHASTALTFPFQGFSLRWYAEVFENDRLLDAVVTSLSVALATSSIVMALGVGFSVAWLNLKPKSRSWFEALCIAPVALPGLFIGIALLIFFAQVRLTQSLYTIVIAHVVLALPVLAVTMRARLALYDKTLNEAARDLGATPWQSVRRITFPQIAPFILACGLLTFAISFDEFVITFFVSGTETTVPMFIWSMMRRTVTPVINAVSTLALGVTLLALALAWLATTWRRRTALAQRKDAGDS